MADLEVQGKEIDDYLERRARELKEVFKRDVLENPMFDAYDRQIIGEHLSNFFIVFQLGADAEAKLK
jgi:hypothetical protein